MTKAETKDQIPKQLDIIEEEYRKGEAIAFREAELRMIEAAARRSNLPEAEAKALYLRSRILDAARKIPEARKLNDDAAELAAKHSAHELALDCAAAEAIFLVWDQKLKEAYHLALQTHERAEGLASFHAMVQCCYILGSISMRYSSDDKALQDFQEGLDMAREHGYRKLEVGILHILSELFLTRLRFDLAEKYAKQCLCIQEELNSLPGILGAQLRLVTVLIEKKDLAESLMLIDEITIHEDELRPAEKGTLALCRGKAAQCEKKYSEAQKHLKIALAIFSSIGRPRLIANACAILCEMYLEQKNAKNALIYAKRGLNQIAPDTDNYLQVKAYRLMYEASKLAKNAANALKYLELYNERFSKQEEQLLEARIQFIELHAEYEMKQSEINKIRQRSEALRIELELKERELTEKTRHLIKQTESMAQFRDDLRAIIRRSPADDPLIRRIKERLKMTPKSPTAWEDFDKEFQSVYPVFVAKLEKKHSVLTAMEKKICTMLRLGLTSTDIAKLLNLSVRNIENHRYRIRKKLSLNTEKSLHEYLAKV